MSAPASRKSFRRDSFRSDLVTNVSGVSEVSVDLDKGEATYDGDVSEQDVKDAIVKVGFEAP